MCWKHMYQRLLWVNTSHFMFSLRYHVHKSDRQKDRWTEGQTHRQTEGQTDG